MFDRMHVSCYEGSFYENYTQIDGEE